MNDIDVKICYAYDIEAVKRKQCRELFSEILDRLREEDLAKPADWKARLDPECSTLS